MESIDERRKEYLENKILTKTPGKMYLLTNLWNSRNDPILRILIVGALCSSFVGYFTSNVDGSIYDGIWILITFFIVSFTEAIYNKEI